MPEPYIGEVRMFAGTFAPVGWAFCDGQLMPISENDALFALIGTTYGGDGESTFALPNLQSRVPLHMGTGPDGTTYQIGQLAGTESETLTVQQIPIHSHALLGSTENALQTNPSGNVPGTPTAIDMYRVGTATIPMASQSIGPAGGSQPHDNTQPFLCINYIISLFGIFPSQT